MTALPSQRPRRAAPASDLPPSLQSVPSPRISLLPKASLLPDLSKYSLLAPSAGPRRNRGHGVVAGFVATCVAAAVDVLTSASDLARGDLAAAVAHGVAACAPFGLAAGLLLEALLASGARVVPALQAWRWIARGPRAWFAPDPGLSSRIALTLLNAFVLVGSVFLTSEVAAATMHNPILIGAVCAGACVLTLALLPLLSILAAPPVRLVCGRYPALASPGALAVLTLVAPIPALERASEAAQTPPTEAQVAAVSLAATLLTTALGSLFALRRSRLGRAHLAALAGAAGLCLGLSGASLDTRGEVVRAVAARSNLPRLATYALRRVTDFDRDGASAFFGGGDCDDGDPGRHPSAFDAPGNRVDENCSGEDARPLAELPPPTPPTDTGLPAAAKPSFILITVDTMRADHLGAFGYRRPTSPNIDSFARGAAVFERAYTAVPRTIPSLGAIWTGLPAARTAWAGEYRRPVLLSRNTTLAEALRGVGYETAAFVGSDCFNLVEGFFQGFATVRRGVGLKGDSAATTRNAAAWIRAQAGRPFFAWVHLLDPHAPYRPATSGPRFGPSTVDRYDEEIARVDGHLAAVFAAAAELEGRPERPLVTVLSADHGEAFNEHGVLAHAADLHAEALRIPLIIRAPGVSPGPRRGLTSSIDLRETMLDYAGLRARRITESRSLVPALRAPDAPDPTRRDRVFSEAIVNAAVPFVRRAAVTDEWSFLWDPRVNVVELYDNARDPAQRRNLAEALPDVAGRLQDDLAQWSADAPNRLRESALRAARLRTAPSPAAAIDARFERAFDLVGFDLPSRTTTPGGAIELALYLRAVEPTWTPLTLAVELASADGSLLVDASHQPVLDLYPSTEWARGEWIRDAVTIPVPPRAVGRMKVRLSVRSGDGAVVLPVGAASPAPLDLGEITVAPAR